MANVQKKDGGELARRDQPQQQQLSRDPFQMLMRDPFAMMREMMSDPFRMFQMNREISWNPSFEVKETNDAFLFKADMPGIRNDDLDITLDGNRLMISGQREQEREEGEEQGRYHAYERSYGSFSRMFTLPDSADVDHIRTDLKDGVLTLVVPKKAGGQPQRRKIQIGSGSKA
jgi:HSP20 family protein